MKPTPHRHSGFTLIELMTTIFIAAILLTMAVPSFSNYQANQRVRSSSENLVSALNFARSEAIKRGVATTLPITLQPITSGVWADGWTVTTGTQVLADYAAMPGITITASPATLPAYNRDGRLSSSSTLNFTVAPSSSGSATSACVRVAPSGKATITRTGACS